MHLVESCRRHAITKDFAEQRMRERDGRPPLVLRSNEPPPLQLRDEFRDTELLQAIGGERLTHGDKFECCLFGVIECAHTHRDEMVQPFVRIELPAPPPHALLAPERAGFDTMADELAQEQRIAVARLPQEAQRCTVDRIVEHARDDGLDFGAREWLQCDERRGAIRPYRRDRVGRRLAAAHRDDRRRNSVCNEESHERGRRVVEKMRVVDTQEQSRAVVVRQRADHAAQGRVAATTDRPFRNEMRDRAQRNRCRRVRRRDPLRAVAGGRNAREHRAGEAGLADTGRACEHHAAPRGHGRGRQIELVVPSDQRPPAQVEVLCTRGFGCVRHPPRVHRTLPRRTA